jgi:hypothetical protein
VACGLRLGGNRRGWISQVDLESVLAALDHWHAIVAAEFCRSGCAIVVSDLCHAVLDHLCNGSPDCLLVMAFAVRDRDCNDCVFHGFFAENLNQCFFHQRREGLLPLPVGFRFSLR